MVFIEDLRLKADLLVQGVDFTFPGLIDILYSENRVRPGNGLYNYHRTNGLSKDNRHGLTILGQSNIRVPNEIVWNQNSYGMRSEVRSNPLSDYRIILEGNSYFLTKKSKDSFTLSVDFPVQKKFNFKETSYGSLVGEVVHIMGENALRVYPDMTCAMDKPGVKCSFCGVLPKRRSLSDSQIIDELKESLNHALSDMPVDHIFMSTGAFYDNERTDFYSKIIQTIKDNLKNPHAEILFALTPPKKSNHSMLEKLIESGLTDVSFNLEAWDDNLWDIKNCVNIGSFKIQMGKKDHFDGYNLVTNLLGPGSAKSNFVGGIEGLETFFEGADILLDLGVIPSMTVYYPTPGSEWVIKGIDPRHIDFKKDPINYLLSANIGLAERIKSRGFKPHWARRNRISGLEVDSYSYIVGDSNITSRVEDRMNHFKNENSKST